MNIPVASVFDGLASNLIAEFVGLVSGMVVTYLIVDRLSQRNLRRQYKPLSARFKAGVTSAVSSMLIEWAVALKVITALDDLLSIERTALNRQISDRVEVLTDSHSTTAPDIDSEGARRLAAATVDAGAKVSHIADRLAQIVASNIDLQALISDFEDAVEDVNTIVILNEIVDEETAERDVDRAVVDLSRKALDRGLQLRDYVERHL